MQVRARSATWCWAVLAACIPACLAQAVLQQWIGELQVLHVHYGPAAPPAPPSQPYPDDTAEDDNSYIITADDGTPLTLYWPPPTTAPPDLKAGLVVSVTGILNTSNTTISVYDLQVLQQSDNKEYVPPGTQLRITSLTFVLNICGVNAPNINTLRQQWTNDYGGGAGTPGGNTIQNYHALCSYNKTVFLPGDNLVLGPITLGCNGTTNFGTTWVSGSCGDSEIWGWAQAAEKWAIQNTNLNLNYYKRRIIILPDTPACQWAGLGSVGCGSSCNTWLQGSYALDLSTVMHELGHNLGLQHSATPGNEYGDCYCPMGGCSGMRCYSAPQQWRLGWSLPLASLDKNTVPVAAWRAYQLPALQASPGPGSGSSATPSDTNHLRITPNWQPAGTTQNVRFVSFKQRLNGDAQLASAGHNKVFVHTYDGDQAYSAAKPVLQMALDPGVEWVDVQGPSKMKIRFDTIVNNLAVVRVCRFSSDPSECPANGNILNTPVCGDGFCGDAEATSCPQDCVPPAASPPPVRSPPPGSTTTRRPPPPSPPPPVRPSPFPPAPPPDACVWGRATCGDSFCDAWAGETCKTCPQDCRGRSSLLTKHTYCCGDSTTGCLDVRCTQRAPRWLYCRANCSAVPADGLWIATGTGEYYDYGAPPPQVPTSALPPPPTAAPPPLTSRTQTGGARQASAAEQHMPLMLAIVLVLTVLL